MALANSEWLRGSRAYKRIGASRLALGAVAVVLGALWAFNALSAVPAIVAFLLIAGAILFSREIAADAPISAVAVDSGSITEQVALLETVLAGLPQPVIALDVAGRSAGGECAGPRGRAGVAPGRAGVAGAAGAGSPGCDPARDRERRAAAGRVHRARAARALV